jgi:hypothetical protein
MLFVAPFQAPFGEKRRATRVTDQQELLAPKFNDMQSMLLRKPH